MSDVTLDTKAFFKRAGKVFAAYEQPTPETADMADMAAIQVIMGDPNDDGLSYSKSSAMQVSFWPIGMGQVDRELGGEEIHLSSVIEGEKELELISRLGC